MKTLMKSTVLLLCLALAAGVQASSSDEGANAPRVQLAQTSRSQADDDAPARPTRSRTPRAREFQQHLAEYHRGARSIPGAPAQNLANPESGPQRYDIADCGNGLVCCSYTGEGSTCNLFKLLCSAHGGTASGDGSEAVCAF